MSSWPHSRLAWLRALCGVSEGATTAAAATALSPCVAAVLGDPQKRLCVLGGRDGMPWSLGSVLGSSVTRFLAAEDTWDNTVAVVRKYLDELELKGVGGLSRFRSVIELAAVTYAQAAPAEKEDLDALRRAAQAAFLRVMSDSSGTSSRATVAADDLAMCVAKVFSKYLR